MILENAFVINPEEFFRPSIRISPFNTSFIKINKNIVKNSPSLETKSLTKHFGNNFLVTASGKEAISMALSSYNLQPDDNVLIVTTTGNTYISNCVTKTIERFCSWTREHNSKTKVILVNHEFGYPFMDWGRIEAYNLPIIEDRAYSLFSTDANSTTGKKGDFVVYSLPKWFPVQMGGILQVNAPNLSLSSGLSTETQRVLLLMLKYYLRGQNRLIKRRRANYDYFVNLFSELDCPPFFAEGENVVPGAFMFRNVARMNLPELRKFMQDNGVESSVFYGENAFYLPVHQNLTREHIEFIYTLVRHFKNRSV